MLHQATPASSSPSFFLLEGGVADSAPGSFWAALEGAISRGIVSRELCSGPFRVRSQDFEIEIICGKTWPSTTIECLHEIRINVTATASEPRSGVILGFPCSRRSTPVPQIILSHLSRMCDCRWTVRLDTWGDGSMEGDGFHSMQGRSIPCIRTRLERLPSCKPLRRRRSCNSCLLWLPTEACSNLCAQSLSSKAGDLRERVGGLVNLLAGHL